MLQYSIVYALNPQFPFVLKLEDNFVIAPTVVFALDTLPWKCPLNAIKAVAYCLLRLQCRILLSHSKYKGFYTVPLLQAAGLSSSAKKKVYVSVLEDFCTC